MRVRVWRNDSAQTTIYTPFRELMQIRNISGVFDYAYIYDGSTLVARVNPDGSKWYYHPDHLGSTTLITDESGEIVEQTFYEPYGAVTSGGSSEAKLYTGQFADDISNQYYYGARYYNPHTGGFTQADGLLVNAYDPQFLNRYAYARNNPYAFSDETGQVITHKVENYRGNPIISIYQDNSYIGRASLQIVEQYSLPSPFAGGSDIEVTSYDYLVQRGSRTLGTTGEDSITELFQPEELLSNIVARDKERSFKRENLDRAEAAAYDITGVLSLIKGLNFLKHISRFGSLKSGISGLQGDPSGFVGAVPIPGFSSLGQALRDYNGYQPYTQIREYRGEIAVGSIGESEALIDQRGKVNFRWGIYGKGNNAYCTKNCG
jgi:RHS repeat-associated protein